MKRERIQEIIKHNNDPTTVSSYCCTSDFKGIRSKEEEQEILNLALRAADPDMVMVPIADIIDVGKEPFKDGACEQCYPHQEFTKPGFRCVYHEAADKYRAHFQEDQQ